MEVDCWSSTKKIQLKENSTDNYAEKNLKEDSNLKNSETFLYNTLSDKFPANYTKIFNTLSFLFLSFLFLCINFPFENFIVCVIFSNQYPNKKAAELTVKIYCLNLLFE